MRHALAGAVLCLLAALPASGQSLFELGGPAPDSRAAGPRRAAEQRMRAAAAVDIDFALLRSAPTRLVLNTPDGCAVVAERAYFEDRASAGVLWRGRIAGDGYDSVVLTAANGFLFGSFSDGAGRNYWIETNAAGAQVVTTVARPARPGTAVKKCGVVDRAVPDRPESDAPPRSSDRQAPSLVEQAPDAAEIDMMILYTAEAAELKGGGKAIRTLVRQSVDYLNTVLSNSRAAAKIRLVHVAEAPEDATTHLGDVTKEQGRLFQLMRHETVAKWRTRYGADLVHLFLDLDFFVDADFPCEDAGVWEKDETRESMVAKAFGITPVESCGPEPREFAHVVGHNFGGMHDPANLRANDDFPSPRAYKPYVYGYLSTTDEVHTMMSYGDGVSELAPYFSNVDLTWKGKRIGKKGESDVARVIRETAPEIAQLLRSVSDGGGDGDGDGDGDGGGDAGDPTVRYFGDVAATPTGDAAVTVRWRGKWADAAKGMLAVEARDQRMGWRRLTTARASDGMVRIDGLMAGAPYTFRLRAERAGEEPEHSMPVSATIGVQRGACRTEDRFACLRGGRFEVQTHWTVATSSDGFGTGKSVPVAISDESALFWFFNAANVELVVKVLDGSATNGNHWVFYGALSDVEYWITVRDTMTGDQRTYHNMQGRICGLNDTAAFLPKSASQVAASLGSGGGSSGGLDLLRWDAPVHLAPVPVAGTPQPVHGGGHCESTEDRLCVLDDRFALGVRFVDPNRSNTEPTAAKVASSLTTAETGFFWFFQPTNIELAAKVLDGRAQNGSFWLLYGGVSDVEYTLTVTDTVTGDSKSYRNERGSICGKIDTAAF